MSRLVNEDGLVVHSPHITQINQLLFHNISTEVNHVKVFLNNFLSQWIFSLSIREIVQELDGIVSDALKMCTNSSRSRM